MLKVDDLKQYMTPIYLRKITLLNDFSYWDKRCDYEKDSSEIANKIVSLALLLKLTKKVAISSLAPRKNKLNAKAKEVNIFLKEKCEESKFDSHFNNNPHCYTILRGLHLNYYGTADGKFLKLPFLAATQRP